MGHREDLLEGAKRCLREKGYARTTARDIVAASGTNLASIGYHYGSKEALLNAALMQTVEEWGDELRTALASEVDPGATPVERFVAIWTRMIDSLAEQRPIWAASYESFTQIDRLPEVRAFLTEGLRQARSGMAALFLGVEESALGEEELRTVGSFYYALLNGVMVQWMIDPDSAPSAHDLAEALRAISARMGGTEAPTA
ncbi:TetR/AcrR family transcriptional regulator [Streptantibioticus ferralitis]|uniref:TetR/AcrR family transcriptional regulator n=1 Tax=Streptantibioticus ferralitis TaxID=236510 RepID=A0ABT5YV02_9ACTN|nr:TetR/AcrR family transcriptional regulator [Streptantibioticus ferralitis]MDF2255442.1 TetR/AcrR family transcriptional regulator [Streptantibioticus ferralitis]